MKTIDISPRGIEILDGINSVAKRVEHRLLYIRGEWLLNPAGGVPYVSVLLGRNLDAELVASEIASGMRRVDGVESTTAVEVGEVEEQNLDIAITVDSEGESSDLSVNIGNSRG